MFSRIAPCLVTQAFCALDLHDSVNMEFGHFGFYTIEEETDTASRIVIGRGSCLPDAQKQCQGAWVKRDMQTGEAT